MLHIAQLDSFTSRHSSYAAALSTDLISWEILLHLLSVHLLPTSSNILLHIAQLNDFSLWHSSCNSFNWHEEGNDSLDFDLYEKVGTSYRIITHKCTFLKIHSNADELSALETSKFVKIWLHFIYILGFQSSFVKVLRKSKVINVVAHRKCRCDN